MYFVHPDLKEFIFWCHMSIEIYKTGKFQYVFGGGRVPNSSFCENHNALIFKISKIRTTEFCFTGIFLLSVANLSWAHVCMGLL